MAQDEPRALIAIFTDLAYTHPQLVLEQGPDKWSIEDLLGQARRDRHHGARPQLEALRYDVVKDSREKLSIIDRQLGSIVFSEVGAVTVAPVQSP